MSLKNVTIRDAGGLVRDAQKSPERQECRGGTGGSCLLLCYCCCCCCCCFNIVINTSSSPPFYSKSCLILKKKLHGDPPTDDLAMTRSLSSTAKWWVLIFQKEVGIDALQSHKVGRRKINLRQGGRLLVPSAMQMLGGDRASEGMATTGATNPDTVPLTGAGGRNSEIT